MAHLISENIDLPDLETLKECLNQTQKNNGTQLITCTYLFFEMIMKRLVNIENQKTDGPSYSGYEFGFLLDANKFEQIVNDNKKVPIQKVYPNMLKPLQYFQFDFFGISCGFHFSFSPLIFFSIPLFRHFAFFLFWASVMYAMK